MTTPPNAGFDDSILPVETPVISDAGTNFVPQTASPSTTRAPAKVKRVLHVINGEHYAGAERVQDLLAMCLPEFGYEVGFACVKPDKFPSQRKAKENVLYDVAMKFKFDLRSAKSPARVAKIGGYDLMHAHGARAVLVTKVASAIAKIPFVYHVHSPTSNDTTNAVSNKVNSIFERLCLTGVSKMICVSNSLGDHMRLQGYNPSLVTVVPNGVPAHGELSQRSAPKDAWVLGMIALFRPRKGTEVLIEALSILRSYGYDVRLRAVGTFETPEYELKIKELAQEHGVEDAIDWTGFTSDVNAELAEMDVMVLPALFGEGLPMVILEAMAAGVPVVSTRVQGVPEVLQDGNGLVAAPGCPKDLANNIRRLIRGDEDWTSIRENAWQRQSDLYSDRSMAKGVADVYDTIVETTSN